MVTLESAARIVYQQPARAENQQPDQPPVARQQDLFQDQDLFGVQKGGFLKKCRNRVLSDIDELFKNNRWEDIISLYHPATEKVPELVHGGMDLAIREKTAFALGQMKRFDEAIAVLKTCVAMDPDNFAVRSSLAYTAYNSLFAARNKEILLAGKMKADRIGLAHENFRKAQSLRPDGVTNFYREGMLFAQIENKPETAVGLFNRACVNWEKLDDKEQAERHQEKKNYIKSLYRSASLLLASGSGKTALERIKKCLEQDEQTNHVSLAFKYFALGKVYFCLDEYEEARNALLFALQSSVGGSPVDFIHELLARTFLALDKPDRALEIVEKVPERLRRPYYQWTEADVLCCNGRHDKARAVLLKSAEKDGRSRHITLIRLAKIDYATGNHEAGAGHAEKAVAFFREKWGNAYYEGLFWQALCTFKAGRAAKAEQILAELEAQCRFFPDLDRLRALIRGKQ